MVSEESIYTVGELIKAGVLYKPLDGNHGGIHPKGNDFVESGIPFVMASDMSNGQVDTKTCKFISADQASTLRKGFAITGDVLISHKATIGRTAIVGEIESEFIVLTPQVTYYRVKDTNQLNNRYLKYYFDSYEFQGLLNQWAGGGSTRAYLGITGQLKLPIKILDIQKQKAIAHILGSLDDKIELNRQMNETLEAMAQALFKSWFVDFDPVIDNALAAGNAIPDELLERAEQRKTIEKKDKADIQKLFPDAFEFTEEMGWIPKGWAVEKLEQKIDVLNGFAFKSKDYVEKGLFVLRTKNFTSQGGVELLTDDVYLPNEFKDTFSKYLSEPFDYHLIMVGASVGNRGLIEPHQLPALRNQNMWCFRPKPNSEISKSYVKYMLDFITPLKLGLASGSAREFFRKGDFQTHQLCLPSNSVLNAFDQIAFSYLNKQAQNNSVNVSLSKLRDTLLPKLMSGELRIPDDIF